MKIHKEGIRIIIVSTLIIGLINYLTWSLSEVHYLNYSIYFLSAILYFIIVYFFRNPSRIPEIDDTLIYAPADGKVVVIEETIEDEYFKDKRLQVSVFMSPLNVHFNKYPISGVVTYARYHPGEYLVAWNPKSSTKNERTTTVIKNKDGVEIMVRQVAGALARRIVSYAKEGNQIEQGEELGFIKFGSRVDLYLPLGTKIIVGINEKSKANSTIIGKLC